MTLKQTATERLIVMEEHMKQNTAEHIQTRLFLEKMDAKLDKVIAEKADKIEIDRINDRVDKWVVKITIGLITLLIGTLSFLLKYTLYT